MAFENFRAAVPPRPRLRSTVYWLVVLVGGAGWTLLAWLGFIVGDALLGWLATNGDALLQTGKDAGTLVGVPAETGIVVEGLKSTGAIGQIIALVRAVLGPVVLAIWGIGLVVLVLLPRLLSAFAGMFAARRY